MSSLGRRKFLTLSASAAGSSCFLKACAPDFTAASSPTNSSAELIPATSPEPEEIKIGIIHSLSGAMAVTEAPLVDAEKLAIAQINDSGGVLGKPLVPLIEDGASDWPTFAEKAEKLVNQEKVAVLFGGYTSASRKAMLPVVKAQNKLLWYPGNYEGQECSDHVFYTGATANQQIEPAVNWILGNRGKTFFLVSEGDRTTPDIVKGLLQKKGGKLAGEAYVPIKAGVNADMKPIVSDLKQAMPEGGIIFNSLLGNQNRTFFKELKSAGLPAYKYIVMSLHLTEAEVFQMGKEFFQGHYAIGSYFQSVEDADAQAWTEAFQQQFVADEAIGDSMAAAYTTVQLWAKSVQQAQTTGTQAVRAAAYGQSFKAPSGVVTLQTNHHLSKMVRIAKVTEGGRFEIVWQSPSPIHPNPWSQQLTETRGYACDWFDPQKGEQYLVEAST